ncbi:MAG: translocation/assembly module TamB domain-containing protein [Flavisolibacter sp.]
MDFSKINGSLQNIGWIMDTVTGNINISAQERSGLVIKSLKAKTTVHPQAMIFDNFFLQTNRSILSDYFAMRFENIGSMANFIHAVTMEARFKKSTISSDDIAFFAPDVKTWKKNIKIDGDIRGTVDALSSKDLEVWAGNNTYVRGALSLVGLPNINETLINIEAGELRTTYGDAVSFIPAIRSIETPDLNKLTYLRFKGTYTGFINDFVTYGTIQTNLGTLQTDLNMKFPKNGEPVYAGTVSTEGFELGSFINSPKLGLVDFHGKVKGKGFKWQTLNLDIDGIVHRIEYGDYTYRNITAKGNLTKRLFNGDFTMKDPNADMHLTGLVDLTGAKPFFNVRADIVHANLKALQITPRDMELSGRFDLDLTASSLSDLLGSARITNASLLSKGKRLSFDSLIVTSNYVNGLKTLTAVSNEFNATVTGDFDLQGLPDAFTAFLTRYYPSYIKAPHYVKPQVFTFDITTGIVDDYMHLIDTSLSGFNNSHITGSLNTSANTMTVDADVPHFQYRQYDFSDVQLKGSGDLEKLILTGQVANAQVADSLFFPQTNFSIQAQNDVSDITINTSSNQAINQANLAAQIQTFSDGAIVLFRPSTFVLNGKTWTIEQGGELNFRRNTVVQGQVLLKESNQEIRIWTEPSAIGTWNDLHASIVNLNLGDVSPFLMKSNHLEGLLSAEIIVEDPQNRSNISSTLHASELRIDGDSLGRLDASVAYNNKTGMLTGSGNNLDPEHKIDFNLAMNLKDTANVFQDRINARLGNFQLKYLNRFLGGIFSDIQGYVTGNVDVLSGDAGWDVVAKAKIRSASFRVLFSQVTYTIDDTEIEMKKDLIDLNNIRIRDSRGYPALVKGYIKHKAFSDMFYDIQVETESNRMLLMNTTYADNEQFYGRAYGSGTFVLVGKQSDMLMDINVKASETDSSSITLPPAKSRESGQASFLVERKYGREMTPQSFSSASNMHYDIHLAANPRVNIGVILDELTGDSIQARGTGNLLISSGTSEPLSITGRYQIEEGNYVFTFQSMLKKPFVLRKKANNFIEWSGDPYEANIHLEAAYTAEQVSFAPLATLFAGSQNLKNATNIRDDVDVVATLTGSLFHPSFDFRLEFPTNSEIYSLPDFNFAVQQIEKNPNELNKQVTYLIVFNSFAPFENSAVAGYAFGELYYNTISGLLFGKVNQELNRILGKILKNNNATLSFTGSLYNRDLVSPNSKNVFRLPNQSNVNVSLGLPLFNDRLHFTVGATLDVPLADNIDNTIQLFPDVTLELLVNKSGSVRATFFYRRNTDFLSASPGNIPSRYGASIGYGKEFNTLGELFGKKKTTPAPQRDSTQKLPVTDSSSSN